MLWVQAHVCDHLGVHLSGAGHFKPAPCQRPAGKLNVNFRAGLGEGEKAGAKSQHQIRRLKKGSAEIGEDHLQVFEADVLSNPQTLTLVKHGGMGCIAVHAVSAPWGNHANFRHDLSRIQQGLVALDVADRMANLHRAGVGAQQVTTFHIKGVVHGARGVIFWRIECSEVVPIGLYFWPLRHFKAHGVKNLLDALQGQTDWVQATRWAQTPRQTHIQGLRFELAGQLFICQRLSALGQGHFHRLFGLVDGSPLKLFLFGWQRRQALHQLSHTPGFT